MLLFRSEEHVERWTLERGTSRGAFLTLEQQWELSRIWFHDRLDPGFRRRTIEEAQAVFERIGLTGAFWSLTG
jgi:hypothetical protein